MLLTAHGTSDRVKLRAARQGLEVHDATCPLVTRVHLALRKLVAEGRHPVVIGQAEHVEVRGLVGDLDEYTIILDESDLDQLDERLRRDPRPGWASWPRRRSRWSACTELVEALGRGSRTRTCASSTRFASRPRTASRRCGDLADEQRRGVVVGGPDSNNSRKLAELARQLGRPAYQVASASRAAAGVVRTAARSSA